MLRSPTKSQRSTEDFPQAAVGCHPSNPVLPRTQTVPSQFVHFTNSNRSFRFISKLSASHSTEASTSLATYNLEFRRSHSLFESFLVELIKHLDEAPVLQSIMVSDQITFQYTKNLPNDDYQDQLHKDSDVFMYCKAISKDPVPGGRKYLAGSIGDCCEESLESSKEADEDSQFWGLVVKSSLFPRMEGCYLLRTSRVSAGSSKHDCVCTHYSLTKISAGVPLADQYDASWLA